MTRQIKIWYIKGERGDFMPSTITHGYIGRDTIKKLKEKEFFLPAENLPAVLLTTADYLETAYEFLKEFDLPVPFVEKSPGWWAIITP